MLRSMPKDKNSLIEIYIKELSQGNKEAMGKLYELIKTDVYAYAFSKLANKQDAEDITHDTFVQIYKNARLYSSQGKPLAWIFTIELNLIRRLYNSNKHSVSLNEAIEVKSTEIDFSSNIVEGQFLNQMLKLLNEEERAILTLHVVSGLKHREIATILNKPLSTILSKYNRAIKKLQSYAKEVEE